MAITRDAIAQSLVHSFETAALTRQPYDHWLLSGCVPEDALEALLALPFPPPALSGISGKRELHNGTRKYFDIENRAAHPVIEAMSAALQSRQVTDAATRVFGTPLAGSYLRVEYAQDTDDFWLEPHTDLGVKRFTMLLYISRDAAHADLGTDIYDNDKRHVARSPFTPNAALVFVPSDITFHGFEKRRIAGIRKSIIINYVTTDWRAREQLAYPDTPIAG